MLNTVKVLSQDENNTRVGGYAVVFGGKDLMGDYFTPDTDFMPSLVPEPMLTYDHTMRAESALNEPIGRVVKLTADEKGLWMEAELSRAHEYHDAIAELVGKSTLGLSTGSVGHLVRGEIVGQSFKFTRWPIVEVALTATPAEPRTLGVEEIKQLFPEAFKSEEQEAAQEAETPQVAAALATENAVVEILSDEQDYTGEKHMSDNAEMSALATKVDALTSRIEEIMQYTQDSPALRKAGYISVDGGTADPHLKSFGDWLFAVRRNDVSRLTKVYATKTMNEDTGTSGGYLVPVEYNTQLLQIAAQNSGILSRVNRMPVNTAMGKIPALDNFTAPTAGVGQTAAAGGLKPAKRAEGGSFSAVEPAFVEIEYRVSSAISGYVPVTMELNADSPASIESLLRSIFAIADMAKQEYYFLLGNGVGEPLGAINSPAAIGVTPATNSTFAYVDAVTMASRYKSIGNGSLWSYHPSMIPDIGNFQTGSGGTSFVTDISQPLRQTLLGYPTYASEHQAQADASGCVLLADWSAYMVFDRGGLEISFSEHALFTSGQVAWRFNRRLDGKPWWSGTQTLGGAGSAFTVSPFVYFND